MKDSLKKLLASFPYFFDKNPSSNFYKSQNVTNNMLQGVYQSLFDLIQSLSLSKRCLVWKEQTEPYLYVINFVANFENLKNVTLYKNDDEIYGESFSFEDEISSFHYSYEGNTLNDTVSGTVPLIPEDKFSIRVETWDEHIIEKGFPENDTLEKNIFDHDISLDEIGALNNIPRKEYLIVSPELYPRTEPPYNNRASEDDYHYMKRIIEYNQRMHTDSPVILEIWKLYGINATLENREKDLIKFFDLEKHPNFYDPNAPGDGWYSGTLDENTGEIIPWEPKPWEHRDKFCDYNAMLGALLFIDTSTNVPLRNQPVNLIFYLYNSLGEKITDNSYVFDIYLDGELIESNHTEWSYLVPASYLSVNQSIVKVICKNSYGDIITTSEITLKIRGCADADWFVSPTGSDSNDGRTAETPFRTIQKALNSVVDNANLITLLEGTYNISSTLNVSNSCTVMSCSDAIINNADSNVFFKITPGKQLGLQNCVLKHLVEFDFENEIYTNNNENHDAFVIVFSLASMGIFTITDGDLIFTANRSNPFSINENGDLICTDSHYSMNENGDVIYTV